MQLYINPRGNLPIWEQIVQQVQKFTKQGVLLPNEKLPSIVDLSSMLIVNPNTISKAYRYLEQQGTIEMIHGKGIFISETTNKTNETKTKTSIQKLLLETNYIGITYETFLTWVQEVISDLRGKNGARN